MADKRIAQIQELTTQIEALQKQIVDVGQLTKQLQNEKENQEKSFNLKLKKLDEKHNQEYTKLEHKKQQIQNAIAKTEEKSAVLSAAYDKKIESLKRKIKTNKETFNKKAK